MKHINKIIYFILIVLTVILLLLFIFQKKEYIKQYNYMNETFIIKIKSNKKISNNLFNEIDELLNKYSKLTDTKNEYEGINNLYFIRHNFLSNEELKLDDDLINSIEKGIFIYNKTNGKIDISKGNLYDLWNEYFELKNGFPSSQEIELASNQKIADIILNDTKIKNNYININLDYIKVPYILNKIKIIIEDSNIFDYYINCNNDIIVGNKKNGYKIAIQDPDDETNIIDIINENNKYISTTNILDYYKYNDKVYSKIIDAEIKQPVSNIKSVTVITNDYNYSLYLSKYLFMLDLDSAKKYVKGLNNVKVIWYTFDNQIITSNN